MKFLLQYNNQGEIVPVWHDLVWHFLVVSCKGIQSHKREPEWTHSGTKVAPVSCKQALTMCMCFEGLNKLCLYLLNLHVSVLQVDKVVFLSLCFTVFCRVVPMVISYFIWCIDNYIRFILPWNLDLSNTNNILKLWIINYCFSLINLDMIFPLMCEIQN